MGELFEIKELSASNGYNKKPLLVRSNDRGCWQVVSHHKNKNGYIWLMRNGENTRAHSLSYEAFVGKIPKGLHVLHRCDQPDCVNPEHLFVGTHAKNMKDMEQKGRHVPMPGEKHPLSKLTEKQVKEIRALKGRTTQRSIAAMFGVSVGHINNIMQRRTWKHI